MALTNGTKIISKQHCQSIDFKVIVVIHLRQYYEFLALDHKHCQIVDIAWLFCIHILLSCQKPFEKGFCLVEVSQRICCISLFIMQIFDLDFILLFDNLCHQL